MQAFFHSMGVYNNATSFHRQKELKDGRIRLPKEENKSLHKDKEELKLKRETLKAAKIGLDFQDIDDKKSKTLK